MKWKFLALWRAALNTSMLEISTASLMETWSKSSRSFLSINSLKETEPAQPGAQLPDAQRYTNLMSIWITIAALPVPSIIAWTADVNITLVWLVPNTRLTIVSIRTIKISSTMCKVPSTSSAPDANSGWKEMTDAQLWPANVVNSSATTVEERLVLMEPVRILEEDRL